MQYKLFKYLFCMISMAHVHLYSDLTYNMLKEIFSSMSPVEVVAENFSNINVVGIRFNTSHLITFGISSTDGLGYPGYTGGNPTVHLKSMIPPSSPLLMNGMEFILVATDSNNKFIYPVQTTSGIPFSSVANFQLFVFDSNQNLLQVEAPLTNPVIIPATSPYIYPYPKGSPKSIQGVSPIDIFANVQFPNLKATYPIHIVFQTTAKVEPLMARALELARAVYKHTIINNPLNLTNFYELVGNIKITKLKRNMEPLVMKAGVLPGWSGSGSGWNLNLTQMQGGNGYAFLQDPWNGNATTAFNTTTKQGVVSTAINVTAIQDTMSCKQNGPNLNCSGECFMTLLGFDENGDYIPDIIAQPPTTFGLYMYDTSGKILTGFPVVFSPDNYVGLGSYTLQPNAKGPAQFIMGGLGLGYGYVVTLNYPFLFEIKWQGKHYRSK